MKMKVGWNIKLPGIAKPGGYKALVTFKSLAMSINIKIRKWRQIYNITLTN